MSEKTEKATPYKLRKAKEQGQVSKSMELNTCIFLLVLLGTGNLLWPAFFTQLKRIVTHLFYLISRINFSVDNIDHLQRFLLENLMFLWLPFALTGVLSLIGSNLLQTGFVWSGKPLVPDFKRLDLSKGLKRLFSSKLIVDAVKNCLKLSLVIALLFFSLRHEMSTFTHFMFLHPSQTPAMMQELMSRLLLQMLLLLLVLAAPDKLYTRWKYARDNRMSRQELKDEYRQREGDPKIKAKIKQLQQQLRRKTASLEQVKTADVVITNPTRLAIALKYERGLMPAPKLVCKAQGDLAKQVRQLAARHRVPIIENKAFARALFLSVELNHWIGQEHFPTAAMIFRDIFRQREMQ